MKNQQNTNSNKKEEKHLYDDTRIDLIYQRIASYHNQKENIVYIFIFPVRLSSRALKRIYNILSANYLKTASNF